MPAGRQWKCRVQDRTSCHYGRGDIATSPADLPVPALPFPRLQHIEWSEKANEVNFVLCQKVAILLSSTTTKHHIIDDQVVAFMGHGSDGTAHAAHRSLHHRPGLDGYGWLALILCRLENHPIRMTDHAFGQHLNECVHRDMQERLSGDRLSALAMELLPTLPTPFRMMIRAFTAIRLQGAKAPRPSREANNVPQAEDQRYVWRTVVPRGLGC